MGDNEDRVDEVREMGKRRRQAIKERPVAAPTTRPTLLPDQGVAARPATQHPASPPMEAVGPVPAAGEGAGLAAGMIIESAPLAERSEVIQARIDRHVWDALGRGIGLLMADGFKTTRSEVIAVLAAELRGMPLSELRARVEAYRREKP